MQRIVFKSISEKQYNRFLQAFILEVEPKSEQKEFYKLLSTFVDCNINRINNAEIYEAFEALKGNFKNFSLINEIVKAISIPYEINHTYSTLFLCDEAKERKTRVTSVKKTKYGYNVKMFNHYVTLYDIKLVLNNNGTAKAHYKKEVNYRPVERFTIYFNELGESILSTPELTDRQIFNLINKTL